MMNDIIVYLLKVSAGLAIICLPYYFLFRNDPNLVIKRFYLLVGMTAAWVFPFITFRKLPLTVDLTPTVFIDLDEPATQAVLLDGANMENGFTVNWLQVLIFVYLGGLILMFLKNIFLILGWNFTWRRTHNEEGVAFTKRDQVFTLFTKIFVPGPLKDQDDLENVLLHEKAHIRQLHFIDLMLMEITLLLTWFNPFSWLISRMIKENHEHLADREVLSAGVNPARYRAQLMNHTLGVNVFRLGTQFNHSLTLNRFKMMKKPKKSPLGIIKIALLVPAVLITLGLTIGMTPQKKTITGKVVFADSGKPATGASVVVRGGTLGCVVDRDGTFKLNVDGDPDLVISFVGYSTMMVKASDVGKKPLELEIETYEMDLEDIPLHTKKDASGSISIRAKDGSEALPVYVVDGQEVVGGVDELHPDEIESISVIKDPDNPLMEEYNARDGLILITTKEAAKKIRSGEPTYIGTYEKEAAKKDGSGEPTYIGKYGKSGTLTIRSEDGSEAEPVYVVDGVVVDHVDEINSKNIESMEVFKDNSESPLIEKYNAKNGLIIITTRDGKLLHTPKEAKEPGEETVGNESDEPVFYIVEDMPEFPGGKPALKTYIHNNLEYPETAKKEGIEGEVQVRFLVNEKGKVEKSEVLRSSYQGFDAPALKVINDMPDWTPGQQRGKAVKVWFVVSVKFNNEKL